MFDRQRGLWIGTAAGIELMEVGNHQRRQLFQFPAGSGATVLGFARGDDGSIWSATSVGLLHFPAHGDAARPIASATLHQVISVLPDAGGTAYASTADGVYRVDAARDNAQRIWPPPGAEGKQVRALARDGQGHLWFSVFVSGVSILDTATNEITPRHRDSEIPHVAGRLRAVPGRSYRHALGRHPDQRCRPGRSAGTPFRYVTDPSHERDQMSNSIRALAEDSSGRVWLGTDGAGLKRYDPAHDSFEYVADAFKTSPAAGDPHTGMRVIALANAGGDKLWVATNHGAFLFDPATHHATAAATDPAHSVPDSTVHALLPARDGSVWFGTFKGLARWWPASAVQPARWETFRHQANDRNSLAHDMVLALHEDNAHRVDRHDGRAERVRPGARAHAYVPA